MKRETAAVDRNWSGQASFFICPILYVLLSFHLIETKYSCAFPREHSLLIESELQLGSFLIKCPVAYVSCNIVCKCW